MSRKRHNKKGRRMVNAAKLKVLMNNKACEERALVRLAHACATGSGIRLSAAEVHDIYRMDQALHQRIYNEQDRLDGVPANEIGA